MRTYSKEEIFINKKGLTLIELLIVIIVVGILATIAIPLYTGYLERARRADAKTALEQLRAAQEMHRAERGGYANAALYGSDANALAALQTTWGVQTNPVGYYNLQWAGGFLLTANSFTAEAAPFGSQVTDGSLFINNFGQKWDVDGVFYPQGKWAK